MLIVRWFLENYKKIQFINNKTIKKKMELTNTHAHLSIFLKFINAFKVLRHMQNIEILKHYTIIPLCFIRRCKVLFQFLCRAIKRNYGSFFLYSNTLEHHLSWVFCNDNIFLCNYVYYLTINRERNFYGNILFLW